MTGTDPTATRDPPSCVENVAKSKKRLGEHSGLVSEERARGRLGPKITDSRSHFSNTWLTASEIAEIAGQAYGR